MTAPSTDIFERIVKLLALAESSNPHEAALAAAQAQRLMFKYNLDAEAVEGFKNSPDASYVSRKYNAGAVSGQRYWRRTLASEIGRYNFAKVVWRTNTPDIIVIGQKHNIAMVLYLYDYLSREIWRLSKLAYERSDKRAHWLTWRNKFAIGAVDAIAFRLKQQFDADRTATSDTMALVVVKGNELDAAIDRFVPGVTSAKGKKIDTKDEAWLRGVTAGLRVPIHKPIEGVKERGEIVSKTR